MPWAAATKAKAPEKAKAGDKAGAPAAAGEMITLGGPNFHLHDGKVQIAVPTTISMLGFEQPVTVVADGGFVKKAGGVAFEAGTLYIGSGPGQSGPFAGGVRATQILPALPA